MVPPVCKLEDCLDSFVKLETLEGYLCEHCHKKQQGMKRMAIHTLPNVLCIVLKRFCWTATSHAKIGTEVLFPFSLDMKNYLKDGNSNGLNGSGGSGGTKYELRSVVMHHGAGLLSGHYTSYCYNELQATWVHYNDSRVSLVTPEDIEKEAPAQAYLLFYQQKRIQEFNIPLSPPVVRNEGAAVARQPPSKRNKAK